MDLIQKIDEFLVQRDATKQAEREEQYGPDRDRFFISEFGSCPRKIAYRFFGIPKKQLDGRTLRVLENGDFLQARLSTYFKEMGVWVAEEVKVSTEEMEDVPILVSGRCDIIINAAKLADPNYNKPEPTAEDLAVVEVKSINTYGYREVAKTQQPQVEHLYQITMYMWLLGIHRGWVVYEDKNDQNIMALYVEYDPRILFGSEDGRSKGLIQEMTELAELIENGTVPPRCTQANPDKFPCKWKSGSCGFYEHCWDPNHNGELVEVAPAENIIEIAGKTFDLNNPPEGYTADDLLRMKALYDMAPAPHPETAAAAEPVQAPAQPVQAPAQPAPAQPAPAQPAPAQPAPAQPAQAPAPGNFAVPVSAPSTAPELPQQPPEPPQAPSDVAATEFTNEQGARAIYCVNCGNEVAFKRLSNGGTITCKSCGHKNPVVKPA